MPRDVVRAQYEEGMLLIGRFMDTYPLIPPNQNAICTRCAGIRLDHLKGQGANGEKYYLHSESYHSLVASATHKCPMCLLFLQALVTHAGIGDVTNTLTLFDYTRKDRPITLRAVRRPWLEKAEEEEERWRGNDDEEKIKAVEVRIETWWGATGRSLCTIFALPGTRAAKEGVQVKVPFTEAEKWAAMEKWLLARQQELLALSTETGCQPRLPTRLIDLGESPVPGSLSSSPGSVGSPITSPDLPIHLIESSTLPLSPTPEYAALSYRWGAGNTLLTTTSTLQQHRASIPLQLIPHTIRDAITVTRRLGIRYLWVDALCIIQDDEADWSKEAATMGDVYMNAVVTISAHAAGDADAGFLKESMKMEAVVAGGGRDVSTLLNVEAKEDEGKDTVEVKNGSESSTASKNKGKKLVGSIHYYKDEMEAYERVLPTLVAGGTGGNGDASTLETELGALSISKPNGESKDEPLLGWEPNNEAFFVTKGSYARFHLDRTELSSRGWVMQERILSPRTIHFGKQGAMYLETRGKVEHIDFGKEFAYRPFPGLRDALEVLDKHLDPQTVTVDSTAQVRRKGELVIASEPWATSPAELTYQSWFELVTRYSGCLLTKNKDKLLALSGIVRKLQQVNRGKYVSGIWCHPDYFHICLLWIGEGQKALEASDDAGAPSWSWASVHGKVQYLHGLASLMMELYCMAPELKLVGVVQPGVGGAGNVDDGEQPDIIEGPAILELEVVMINKAKTNLRFQNYRPGIPWHYQIEKYLNTDKQAPMWDIINDDGKNIGWVSLDRRQGEKPALGETGPIIDSAVEGITCFKVVSHMSDRLDPALKESKRKDRGFVVLFVAYDKALDVWKRVGTGQVMDRSLFDEVEATKIRLG